MKVRHKEIAESYDGCEQSSNTSLTQAVSAARRILPRTIEAIVQVTEMDFSDVIVQSSDLNK